MDAATADLAPVRSNPDPFRFFLLTVVTLGVYPSYWAWRRWQFVKTRQELNVNPYIRAIFMVFTNFQLFRRLQQINHEDTKGASSYAANALAMSFFILSFLGNALDKLNIPLAAFFFGWVVLIGIQSAVVVGPIQAIDHLLAHNTKDKEIWDSIPTSKTMIALLIIVEMALVLLSLLAQG